LILLEILRIICYTMVFVITELQVQPIGIWEFMKRLLLHFFVLYTLCILQMLLEIWTSEKIAFGIMWVLSLGSLFIGDYLYREVYSMKPLFWFINNFSMHIRLNTSEIYWGKALATACLWLILLTIIFYQSIKIHDFIKE
jgi:hypothetical protein